MPWVYGIQAVEGLLRDEPERVQEVWIVRSRRPGAARERLREQVLDKGLRFRMVEGSQLERALESDAVHQGVAARVAEMAYADPLECLEPPEVERSLIVVLDRVQDPRNLGSIIRSSAAFGAKAVVVPRHRSAGLTPAAVKAAAGGLSRVEVARATNLVRFLEDAKSQGYWVCTTAADGEETASGLAWPSRCVLVLGAEGDGVRRGIEAVSDLRVRLPMVGMESLNVAVAAGIFLHAWADAHSGLDPLAQSRKRA